MKNKNSLILVIVIILAIASITAAFLLTNQKKASPKNNTDPSGMIDYITFSCPSGNNIKINYDGDISKATVLFKNKEYSLQRTRSASGARYANEEKSIIFWEHQEEATLKINGETVAEKCTFKEAQINSKKEENQNDNEGEINVEVGKTETFKLDSNPTTGYSWGYDIEDNTIAKITSEEYVPDEQKEELVGAGGTQIYTIKGIKEGTTNIAFEYKRSWESKQPERVKEITVEVIK